MPILLDRRTKIFLGKKDTNSTAGVIFPTDDGTENPNIIDSWCRIEDNGSFTESTPTVVRFFQLIFITRYDRRLSTHPIDLTRIELVGEPYDNLMFRHYPDGRWQVLDRQIPLGLARQRYIQYSLIRANYPVTNI